MNEITMSDAVEIVDPKLRALAQRVAKEMELAVEKVAANHKDNAKFPLPANANSTERVLASRFSQLPQVIKEVAATKAISRINAPKAVREGHFGDLTAVNLSNPASVDEQARALSFPTALKLPASHLQNLPELHGPVLMSHFDPVNRVETGGSRASAQALKKLELRVHNVKCIDETGGWLAERAGDDEIKLGGTTVDATGNTKNVAAFMVRNDFDDGEQKVYSPAKQFTEFNLTEGNTFPKSYFVTLVLAEVDMGGISEFLNKLLGIVKEKVKNALIAAGVSLGGVIGGPLGAAIGAMVGYVVDRVFESFKAIWDDDVFKPVTVSVNIPSATTLFPGGRMDSPEAMVNFSGHDGKYQLIYDWRVMA